MGYRENILNRVEGDARHPIFKTNNVQMQAHHLISKAGCMFKGLKPDLEELGYDINVWENLVLLPCTLQGACHLGVQLHRGNHSAGAEIDVRHGNAGDSDWSHLGYHFEVIVFLQGIRRDRDMGRLCQTPREALQHRMNTISKQLLDMIERFLAPLTEIFTSFIPGVAAGCCGCDSIPDAQEALDDASESNSKVRCATGRDHHRKEGPDQEPENIAYKKIGLYKLEVGR